MMHWIVALVVIWGVWMVMRKPSRPAVEEAAARKLLGVSRSADADAIRAAHRRLAASVHPDRGGSADATYRANAARDLLLAKVSRAD